MPYAKNGDVNIYYEVEGEGSPLVLLHGCPASVESWREYGYVEPLKNDFKLILIDERAHGKSDKPHNPDSYSIFQRVSDVTAVLDDLNIDSAHCFGFSYGGRHVFEMAKLVPARIRSAIVLGMSPRLYNPDIQTRWIQSFELTPQELIESAERAGQIYSESRRMRALANDHEALKAMFANPWPDLEPDLQNMKMPFLILIGENDAISPHEWLKQVCRSLPEFDFVTLKGLDHGQSWHRSDIVLPHVTAFLARVNK